MIWFRLIWLDLQGSRGSHLPQIVVRWFKECQDPDGCDGDDVYCISECLLQSQCRCNHLFLNKWKVWIAIFQSLTADGWRLMVREPPWPPSQSFTKLLHHSVVAPSPSFGHSLSQYDPHIVSFVGLFLLSHMPHPNVVAAQAMSKTRVLGCIFQSTSTLLFFMAQLMPNGLR